MRSANHASSVAQANSAAALDAQPLPFAPGTAADSAPRGPVETEGPRAVNHATSSDGSEFQGDLDDPVQGHYRALGLRIDEDGGGSGLSGMAVFAMISEVFHASVTDEGRRLGHMKTFFLHHPRLLHAAVQAVKLKPLPSEWLRLLHHLEGRAQNIAIAPPPETIGPAPTASSVQSSRVGQPGPSRGFPTDSGSGGESDRASQCEA